MPSPIAHPAASIVFADCVGRGHVNTGMQRYEELKALYDSAPRDKPVDAPTALQIATSAVTNLSLGLEIFLKMHHFQQSGRYPRSHDIKELALSFPDVILGELRVRYAQLHEDPSLPQFATFTLGAGEEGQHHSVSWPAEALNFDTAAQALGHAYVRWRYIYEELAEPLSAAIAFKPLMLMIFALDGAIRDYRSTSYISVIDEAL